MHSVEVEHVSKRYRIGARYYVTLRDTISAALRLDRDPAPDFWALRDISFTVDDGESIGIIGRNGAGKTTLLKVLARVTQPTTGVARMRGRVGPLLEVGTGFHPELSGRENIFLNGAILGMSRADIRRRFDEIVEFSGVEKFLETPVKRYSSGMYLRLAFSVAAHVDPDIVVVDEVLAVGDAEFQRKCLGKMSQFAREGRTVIFVSHDLGALARICPRAIWLENGEIKHDGPATRSIELYLDARGERASYVQLPVEPDDPVQLTAVGVTTLSGSALDTPRRDEPFAVRMRFMVREPVRGLDLKVYLLTRSGVRVLDENLLDQLDDVQFGDVPGEWEASATIPPVLAAGDYVVGVSILSPYEWFFEREVIAFRLWPAPEQRQDSIDRNRVIQPRVEWRVERPAVS
jgi:ABC-type polysaccharide/polyol phosphate transport system ATPase subunit